VDKGQQAGLGMLVEGTGHLGRINRLTPAVLYHDRCGAAALHVFFHAATEHAVLADNNRLTG